MKRSIVAILVSLSLLVVSAQRVWSQQSTPALDQQAMKIKDRVGEIGRGTDVTVILHQGREFYGFIQDIGLESFVVAEVDLKQPITIDYSEVKKVRKGYGGKNYITGKRVNPKTNRIASVALLGALVLLPIILVANSK